MIKAEFRSFNSIRGSVQWTEQGNIEFIRTSANGKRLWRVQSIQENKKKKSFVCARVGSSPEKEGLQRPIQDLPPAYHQVIQDLGSSLNSKRKGLQTVLEQVFRGMVETIMVAYQDRFS
jgi:predicted site-specific integrase-resolvase